MTSSQSADNWLAGVLRVVDISGLNGDVSIGDTDVRSLAASLPVVRQARVRVGR